MDEPGRWWHFDLAARFRELEIYSGHGWGPSEELALVELGERVTDDIALWLPTWLYSKQRDRNWAASSRMFVMVLERIRRDRPLAEQVLRALNGDDQNYVGPDEVPAGWIPYVPTYNGGRGVEQLGSSAGS